MINLLTYITQKIEQEGFRYEVHSFPSGALMVDILANENFYVLHIDQETIGISLVTKENIGFDNIPDRSFRDAQCFKKEFEKILVVKKL